MPATNQAPQKPWRTEGLPPAQPQKPRLRRSTMVLWLVGYLVLFGILTVQDRLAQPEPVPYTEFKNQVAKSNVGALFARGNSIEGELKKAVASPERQDRTYQRFSTERPTFATDDLLAELTKGGATVRATPLAGQRGWLANLLISFAPMLLLVGFYVWMFRRQQGAMGGILGGGKQKRVDPETIRVTFEDVAGIDEVEAEINEVVDFLKAPEKYRRLGARSPKGVLLAGAPGTGKTLLARAVAGDAHVPFISVTGSSFVEMFVGVGAARVRDLFMEARKRAPSIVFIDEIDAIGQRRGGQLVSNDERDQTLNQMLAEMDGFDVATGVVVMAATNRPESLDPALLRPGRFDRQVVIPLPAQKERRAILEVHAKGKQLGPDVDLDVVARGTPGFSGADLANLVNEAAIFAVRAGREVLTAYDFSEARDRVLLGRRDSSNALLPDEKRAVAVHESGHALVAAISEHGDPVAKVTILPAGQALGVTEQLPIDERHLYTEGYLKDSLAIRMGGRVAEQLVFGETSTGASNDLAGATDLATRMVREFGMSQALGPVGFASGSPMYLGGEEVRSRPYAEATQRVVDEEVATLLRQAEDRATRMLSEHRDALERLTELLLERETVDGTDVDEALGRIPGQRQPIGATGHTVVHSPPDGAGPTDA
jgi:cell division protease FtsH